MLPLRPLRRCAIDMLRDIFLKEGHSGLDCGLIGLGLDSFLLGTDSGHQCIGLLPLVLDDHLSYRRIFVIAPKAV